MMRFGRFSFDFAFGPFNEYCIPICFDLTEDYLFVYFKIHIPFFDWFCFPCIRYYSKDWGNSLAEREHYVCCIGHQALEKTKKRSIHLIPNDVYVLCPFDSVSVTETLQYFSNFVLLNGTNCVPITKWNLLSNCSSFPLYVYEIVTKISNILFSFVDLSHYFHSRLYLPQLITI